VKRSGAGDIHRESFCYSVLGEIPILEAFEFANAIAPLRRMKSVARGGVARVLASSAPTA
jgi:hypothetical protein